MMKRFCALALVLALACAVAFTGFADSSASVVYDGTKLTTNGDLKMDSILPGVPVEDSMTITNNGKALTKFYMSTEVTETLEGTASSGYTVKLWVTDKDGNETVLFGSGSDGAQVGGGAANNDELKELNGMLRSTDLQEDEAVPVNYLLAATLQPGESATLSLSITADGTATNNGYMAKVGNIDFDFMCEEVETLNRHEVNTVKGDPVVVTQTRYWLNGVQTGDPVAIAPLVAVLALAVLVFILAAKKKNKKEE